MLLRGLFLLKLTRQAEVEGLGVDKKVYFVAMSRIYSF